MSSQADQYVVESALEPQNNEALFKSKRMVYAVDSNSSGGQFGNEIQFDLGTLGSQGDWTFLEEALVAIPVYTTIQSNNTAVIASGSGTIDKNLTVLKNGSHHFVASAALSINGRMLQDHHQNLNISTHADIMTTWSQEEINKYSSTLSMAKQPDDFTDLENTSESIVFTSNGFSNSSTAFNPSILERKLAQCNLSTGLGSTIGAAPAAGRSIVQTLPTGVISFATGDRFAYVKSDTTIVRLKDICPCVKSLPPLKNIKGYLYIKLNAIECKFTTAGSGTGVITITQVSNTAGNSCPVQLTTTNFLSAGTATAAGDFTLACGPKGVNPSTNLSTPLPAHVNARLIAPKYEGNAATDAAFSMKKTFTVLERRNSQVSLDPSQGNTFNINSGVPNPRFVRVYPFFTGKGTSSITNLPATYNPLMSIVSTEGATTSPMAQLTNFNVYVGNKSCFQDPQMYDYENFLYETSKLGLDGGMNSTSGSGLINSILWERLYRYYCCDVSRRLPSEDGNLKSIQVQATNATKCKMSLIVDVFSEREYTVDTALCQFV